jgi:hypothetical protein
MKPNTKPKWDPIEVNHRQARILLHTLGANCDNGALPRGSALGWRNHYCSNVNPDIHAGGDRGLLSQSPPTTRATMWSAPGKGRVPAKVLMRLLAAKVAAQKIQVTLLEDSVAVNPPGKV